MGVTIDITGTADVTFAPSPLGELAAMLHALVEPGHHGRLISGIDVEDALRRRIEDSALLWRSSRADFLLPGRPAETLREELDAVDRLDDEAFVASALLTTSCGAVPHVRGRSPLVDATTRKRALELAEARGPRHEEFARRLLAAPHRVRGAVRALLEDCDGAFFGEAWRAVRPRLVADARHKADLWHRRGPDRALQALSPATRLTADGRRITVDKLQDHAAVAGGAGLTLSPTVYGDPHLLVVHAAGWRPVIQYPITAADEEAVSLELLARRIRALDHPLRLRILRTIARGAHTTSELADAWQVSAPEISRHLAALREAQLVRSERRGRYLLHELDVVASARLGADLLEALLR